MNSTIKKYYYLAFGLTISSELPISDLNTIDREVENSDIEIKFKDLNEYSHLLDTTLRKYIVVDKKFIFKIPGAAIFCVQDGREILVSPLNGFDLDQLRLYLLGSCMGAILLQRKVLPLHGSAISINGKAYAFIGDSGAGKSTLARGFLKKGYYLLTDDVIAVSLSPENQAIITPSYPQQKLWIESLENFEMNHASFQPIYKRERKYTVPVHSMFKSEDIQLAGIFELVKSDTESNVCIKNVQNLDRLHTLWRNTYRNFLVSDFDLLDWHLFMCTKFVNKLDIYQIERPTGVFTVDDIASLILKKINERGLGYECNF